MKRQTGKQVERVLIRSEKSRSSDNLLLAHILQEQGLQMSSDNWAIFMSVNFESITRCRRKFQKAGLYPPTPEVAKRRRLKAMIVQQNIPTTKAENVPELISENHE